MVATLRVGEEVEIQLLYPEEKKHDTVRVEFSSQYYELISYENYVSL